MILTKSHILMFLPHYIHISYSYVSPAMSYPHEDSFHSHNITEVRTFLEERHPSAYLIFNLTDNHYDPVKVGNQVRDERLIERVAVLACMHVPFHDFV